jgi:diacylglycerol kinase family enzyme
VPGLAVLVNRTARRVARDPALLSGVRMAAGRDAIVIETDELPELDAAARQLRHAQPDTVALCGGDGTYMAGLTALARVYGAAPLPRIALVPGGTVSTVARNFGVTDAPVEFLRRVAARHRAGMLPLRRHRALRANDRVGFIFGAALVATFFDLYYAGGAAGYVEAARIAARVFAESFVGGPYARRVLEPVACRVAVDGVELSARRFSLVCCATVRDLGLHMVVCYRAGERHDAVHLVASSLPPGALGPQMPRVIAGRRLRGREHFDGLVRTFRLTFPEPSPWVLDGDVLRDRVVTVTPGPVLEIVAGHEPDGRTL